MNVTNRRSNGFFQRTGFAMEMDLWHSLNGCNRSVIELCVHGVRLVFVWIGGQYQGEFMHFHFHRRTRFAALGRNQIV
jgi:hypothetical protein